MVFYVEACESGSMFADILPSNINGKYTAASQIIVILWNPALRPPQN